MLEHRDPVRVLDEVLVEPEARSSLFEDGGQRSLADLKRIAPQIVAVQFDQVEPIQEHAPIVPAVADVIERRNAVIPAGDGLSVHDAGKRAQF